MDVSIVADQGTHLLVRQTGRFAIIERRANQLYNCHGGKRNSVAVDDISDVGTILDDDDWTDEATARKAFDEIVSRGAQLGQIMR
jgi:hypothetical protein